MTDGDPLSEPTARGDRDGRRRDVLTAATAILDEVGWQGFSIRAIASRTGVSTGAVYQWFSGKDEIFGALYDREFAAGLELIDTAPEDVSLGTIVRLMLDWVVDLYERIGRYQVEFMEAGTGRIDRGIAPSMVATYEELGKRADAMLDRAATRDGLLLVQGQDRITWFWAGCVGIAERLIVLPEHFAGERREELLRFAAESITRSLIA